MPFVLPSAHCFRCGYDWHPRIARVTICPRCKSVRWNINPTEKKVKAERKRAVTRKRS
jgi:predicted Zn-ribbon and HTH transcriptional regulator